MRHSTLRCTCISIMAACFCFLTGSCVWALTALSDDALEETHAATGIHMTVDNLVIDHTGHGVGFITHDNIDSLELSPGTYGSFGLGNLEMNLLVDGTVELEARPFTFAEQLYFATDVWKEDDFVHVSKTHQLHNTPQFDLAGRQVVVLETPGGLASPFLTVDSVEGQLQAVYGTENYALGTLGVSHLKLIDQRTILYAMPEIPNDIYKPEGPFYCSGEGLAMEIGIRISTDSIKIGSAHEENLTFLEMKGIHLRESFQDAWLVSVSDDSSYYTPQSPYDYLGKREKIGGLFSFSDADVREMYTYSTADPDGYNEGDDAALSTAYGNMSSGWGSTEPSSAVSVDNMYGGRFMIGNLRQVGFTDYIAGNEEVPEHWNHAGQLGWNDPLLINGKDYQNGSVGNAEIIERPLTLGFKTRGDGSSCLVMNLPLHGSIRVEEVVGYNSSGDNSYLGGNSMGPLIVEGLRVKKLYIEFPGRNTTYTLKTAVNENLKDIDKISNPSHDYKYMPGRLPVAQEIIPADQKDYNPMGRGVAEFLDRARPDPGPWKNNNDHTQGVNVAPVDSGWAQYRTELNGKSFWQIREPYPINSDFKDYYVSGYE